MHVNAWKVGLVDGANYDANWFHIPAFNGDPLVAWDDN